MREPSDGFAVDAVRARPGGSLGRHPTRPWQLFPVVDGRGRVRGGDGQRHSIVAGRAAPWAPGEEHASGSERGVLAVVIQCRARPLPTAAA